MIQTCDFIQDDNKTKEELLQNIKICKTTYKDAPNIIEILSNCFGINSEYMALMQLLETDAFLDESVKVIDERDNKIYGFLIFTKSTIQQGTPLFMSKGFEMLNKYTRDRKQINGHSFILDTRLRGTKIDKQMLMFNINFLKKYDFIWCGVESSLKSHNYWKKLGFIELFSIKEASFYALPFKKNDINVIFIINNLLNCKNEDYNNRSDGETIVPTLIE